MKSIVLYLSLISVTVFFMLLWNPAYAADTFDGKSVFRQRCAACHTAGSTKMVGPGLKNIHERRSEEWIRKFVKSSTALIKSGDPDAVAIFNEYNQVVMPDHPDITDAEITALLTYIKEQSASEEDQNAGAPGTTIIQKQGNSERTIIIQRPSERMAISINDKSFKLVYWLIASTVVVSVLLLGGLISRLAK